MSNRGDFRQDEQIAHEYANGLACAVGWSDVNVEILNDSDIVVAVALAEENVQPDRLEKLRRGYLAVHYPKWVTAVFENELVAAEGDAVNAGVGIELTAIRDDRFLGVVLKALLSRLQDKVFDSDASLAAAIRTVLDTVSEGQTLFGRIREGGLGAQAYRRARFLKIGDEGFVINWARTFIKEFYPATLSKRGDSYSLVYDKRLSLILASIRCWLSRRVDGEIPELEVGFEEIQPQTELKALVRERREAGELLESIANEFDLAIGTVSEWCKGIEKLSPTETEVMGLLENGEVWKTSDIEKRSKFTRQRITIAIKNLLEKGFITKIKRGYYQKSGV